MKMTQMHEPVLYIDQPTFKKPQGQMQQYYQSSNVKSKKKEHSFKQLPVREKINYLLQLPSQLPKLTCDVITAEDSYRGIIMHATEYEIKIRLQSRKQIKLSIDKIVDIQLISFL